MHSTVGWVERSETHHSKIIFATFTSIQSNDKKLWA